MSPYSRSYLIPTWTLQSTIRWRSQTNTKALVLLTSAMWLKAEVKQHQPGVFVSFVFSLLFYASVHTHTVGFTSTPSQLFPHRLCPGSRMEREVGAEKCLIFFCLIVVISVLAASCQFIRIIRTGEVVKEFILISRLIPVRKGHEITYWTLTSLFNLLTTARQRCEKERQKQRRCRHSNSLHSIQLWLYIKHTSTLAVIESLLKTHLYSLAFDTEWDSFLALSMFLFLSCAVFVFPLILELLWFVVFACSTLTNGSCSSRCYVNVIRFSQRLVQNRCHTDCYWCTLLPTASPSTTIWRTWMIRHFHFLLNWIKDGSRM